MKVLRLNKSRQISTKRDIRQRLFDKEQLMMFCKIRDVRPQVDTVGRELPRGMNNEVRKLKARQQEEDRQIVIETENRRLL